MNLWRSVASSSRKDPNITRQDVCDFPIALAPIAEQKLITTAITDANKLSKSLEKLLAKKRDLKQAAMQELLSGNQRLPGFQEAFVSATYGELFDFLPTSANSRAQLNADGEALYIHYGDVHTSYDSHLDFSHTASVRIDRNLCSGAASVKNGDWIMQTLRKILKRSARRWRLLVCRSVRTPLQGYIPSCSVRSGRRLHQVIKAFWANQPRYIPIS